MKKENFTILFVIKLTKLNGKGLCPVIVRVAYQVKLSEKKTQQVTLLSQIFGIQSVT